MSQIHNIPMPKHYFPDDAKWIQEMLLQLSPSARNRALVAYSEVYQQHWELEPVSYRKDNKARHEANSRLRQFVRRYSKAMQGYTSVPLLVSDRPAKSQAQI
ncbi:hypothetical protein AB7303_20195 [Providencia rettgeri]|uniref:Uncharacterized protein n=1 Tax=Providencia rettgeri TaxID=587 RepID=A0A379FTE1_PRORE|nr:Uncharacterised protein [Providencia rettgeri]